MSKEPLQSYFHVVPELPWQKEEDDGEGAVRNMSGDTGTEQGTDRLTITASGCISKLGRDTLEGRMHPMY